MSGLNQSGLEINTSAGDSDGLLLSGGFVVARRKARPTAKTFGRGELFHVYTDFGEDRNGDIAVNAGDGAS